MRTLAHISDVHFGREDPELVAGLLESVAAARPDVVVVSGDLTQRAKKKQFKAARAFLHDLPVVPLVVVPGNHDVSWTNMFERAVRPLARYRKYITQDMEPFVDVGELAVAGINTVRAGAVKDGRINRRQMKVACDQLERAEATAVRIVVMHHPIDLAEGDLEHALVGRSDAAIVEFARCRVDLFLSGHLHTGLTLATSRRYRLAGYSAVMAQAGTAVSTRTRGEANAWNLIRIWGPAADASARMEVEQMEWNGKKFRGARVDAYERGSPGWALVHGEQKQARPE